MLQVINFWSVYYRFSGLGNISSKYYRFLKSVLSFSKPQLKFQKIKMSRILLSITVNFGCSSYHMMFSYGMTPVWQVSWEFTVLPAEVPTYLTESLSLAPVEQSQARWWCPRSSHRCHCCHCLKGAYWNQGHKIGKNEGDRKRTRGNSINDSVMQPSTNAPQIL